MKSKIILFISLFFLSTQVLAADPDYSKRIRCPLEAAKINIVNFVEKEKQEDFKEGLKIWGKKMREQFLQMLNFKEATEKMTPAQVTFLVYKADCMMQVATMHDIPNDVNAAYIAATKSVKARTEEMLSALPENPTGADANVSAAHQIMASNLGAVAFMLALFEQ